MEKLRLKTERSEREKFYLSCALSKNLEKEEKARFFGVEKLSCTLIYIRTEKRGSDLLEAISQFLVGEVDKAVAIDQNSILLFKFKDKTFSAYKSIKEFTELLKQFCYEETGVEFSALIGKSVDSVLNARESYSFILKAEKNCDDKLKDGGVYLAEEFSLNVLLNDMGYEKVAKIFPTLKAEKIQKLISNSELLKTSETFIKCNLNACETARVMFIHRNTLSYRLNKIESLTGLNLRIFSHSVVFSSILGFLKKEIEGESI